MKLLCMFGIHKKMFAYKSRPSEEKERRVVEVLCVHCGEIFHREMCNIDNDGNIDF